MSRAAFAELVDIDRVQSDSLAMTMAFSAVPPIPMPSMPGGHHPAPMVGTVLTTQSTMLSDGFNMASFDLFSEPPPFAATRKSTVLPLTIRYE